MAAPIAHIFCALSLLSDGAIEVENKSDFIIGTSFPDIRYLGVIRRGQTHVENVTWNQVKNASTSFEKGRLLHSLLDEVREKFIVKHNLYEFVPDSQFRTQVLKFYEDMLLYETIKNWSEIADSFDPILPEECAYDIKESDVKAWHDLLKQYISHKPDPYQIFLFLQRRTACIAQQESSMIKRFFIRCKGAVLNSIAYFKFKSMLKSMKKSKTLTYALNYFYRNINKFLVKTVQK